MALTEDVLERWMRSCRDPRVAAECGGQIPVGAPGGGFDEVVKVTDRLLEDEDFSGSVGLYGFPDASAWVLTTLRINIGIMSVLLAQGLEELEASGADKDSREYRDEVAQIRKEQETIGQIPGGCSNQEQAAIAAVLEDLRLAMRCERPLPKDPMTAEDVTNWVAAGKDEAVLPLVRNVMERNDGDPQRIREAIDEAAARPEVGAAVTDAGFAAVGDWADTTHRIVGGLMESMMEIDLRDLDDPPPDADADEIAWQRAAFNDMMGRIRLAFGTRSNEEMMLLIETIDEISPVLWTETDVEPDVEPVARGEIGPNTDITLLGDLHGVVRRPAFSPDGLHLAYVTMDLNPARPCVVLDGRPQTGYDGVPVDSLVFSPDGTRLAYVAIRGEQQFVVLDGEEGPPYDGVGEGLLMFSPDSRRLAYVPIAGTKNCVVVDGTPGPMYDLIPHVAFSQDSRHLVYVAQQDGELTVVDGRAGAVYTKIGAVTLSPDGSRVARVVEVDDDWRVTVDGQAGPPYDGIGEGTPLFSADSSRLAYMAHTGGRWFVVDDGTAGPEFGGIRHVSFSPDGQHLSYVGKVGDKAAVVIDGTVSPPYDGATPVIFSPDSSRAAHLVIDGDVAFAVIDGVPGHRYPWLLQTPPVFSSDSRRVAYVASDRTQCFAVVDGEEGPKYDALTEDGIMFSPNGERVAYVAHKGDEQVAVIDGVEGPACAFIVPGSLTFSPDSRHTAYAASNGERGIVVLDGVAGPEFSVIGFNGPTFRADGVLEYVALDLERKEIYRVKQTPAPADE